MSLRKLTRKEQLKSYKQILETIIDDYQQELDNVNTELENSDENNKLLKRNDLNGSKYDRNKRN